MVARLEQVHALEPAWWSPVARKSAADRGKFGKDKSIVWDNFFLRGWRWGLRIAGIQLRRRARALRALRTVPTYGRIVRLQVADRAAFIEKQGDAPVCPEHC